MQSDDFQVLLNFYDKDAEKEWMRMDGVYSDIEFFVVHQVLSGYLSENMEVMDLGCGPGRHALYLAQLGCNVTLVDISPSCLDFAVKEFEKANLSHRIIDVVCCKAEELDAFHSRQYDAVLSFGPFYHILDNEKRQRCLTNMKSSLKSGGFLSAIFISKISLLKDLLKRGWIEDIDKEIRGGYLETGVYRPEDAARAAQYMPAFRAYDVEEAKQFLNGNGLRILETASCEGFAAFMRPYLEKLSLTDAQYRQLLQSIASTAKEEFLLNSSDHFMIVAKLDEPT